MATTLVAFLAAHAQEESFWGFSEEARQPYHGKIWETALAASDEAPYREAVDLLIKQFERSTGKALVPDRHRRAALKVYSGSGSGMQTPLPLVRAVVEALERRGFSRDRLALVDAREDKLRESGFLPPLSRMDLQGPYFEGVRVYALDAGDQLSPTWFYENPLPREFTTPFGRALLGNVLELDPEKARKSFLPENLLTEVDFWINLPMACHHPSTGLSGALVNASLWNVTNGSRFFHSPANAPVAVAEIASIPELKAGWALNLISLESYQIIGGPAFNANYTYTQPRLWMSVDPVALDTALVELVNKARRRRGFEELPAVPEFIEYSVQLGLGHVVPSIERVPAPEAEKGPD
ncbi:MAG TPA: DUF362 domain-containing protein [Oceanipulchritudo sp.]|nr:DUF362 domain-containing protein [Oceanipulchritudo sp.]